MVIKRHCKPSRKLDQKANKSDTAQTIENIDVGGDVLACNVLGEGLNFEAFIKPFEWF
ncbi:hypothetical protein OSCI_630009 [Kamptonema sp. PCC 6506]|nr:hypothetical protein OSCI_630009 [Kamptonema sp. PCC 6506]